jgi:hypothetical protein
MKERDVSRYLNKRVKELGGEVRRVTWQGRRNAPDKLVLLPCYNVAFFAEEKRPGKLPTRAQTREHERMRACGIEVHSFSTHVEIEKLMQTLYTRHYHAAPSDWH